MHAPPDLSKPPCVLFMVGLWDPSMVPADVPDKAAEFAAINEIRAACVRLLRREFGARFFGGVQHTEFTRRHFSDVLMPDARAASKRAYIRRVRDYPDLHRDHGPARLQRLEARRIRRPVAQHRHRAAGVPGAGQIRGRRPLPRVPLAGELRRAGVAADGRRRAAHRADAGQLRLLPSLDVARGACGTTSLGTMAEAAP